MRDEKKNELNNSFFPAHTGTVEIWKALLSSLFSKVRLKRKASAERIKADHVADSRSRVEVVHHHRENESVSPSAVEPQDTIHTSSGASSQQATPTPAAAANGPDLAEKEGGNSIQNNKGNIIIQINIAALKLCVYLAC